MARQSLLNAPTSVAGALARVIIDIHKQTRGVYPLPDWVNEVREYDAARVVEGANVVKTDSVIAEPSKSDRTRV